ncbi:hypothetical protein AB0J82_07685 [Asanoa sp. NPDC049518]|uniref:GTP pyrophosphokinase n=1 Tax=unclassified Asanoa TaxID=2685164 RepID=UPI00343C8198
MEDRTVSKLRVQYESDWPRYQRFADALRILLDSLCRETEIEIDSVQARAKDGKSVAEKLRRKTYKDLDALTDKVGVRVITRYLGDVQEVTDLVEREFEIVEAVHHGRGNVATFGYSSEHMLIRLREPRSSLPEWSDYKDLVAELQVRSILQHAWALISHSLEYKTESEVPEDGRRKLYRVAAMLEASDELFDDFRESVTSTRKRYRSQEGRAEWRSLPVDRDALREMWSKLPIRQLHESAVAAGWRSDADTKSMIDLWSTAEGQSDTSGFWESSVSRLVAVLRRSGIDNLGELADLMTTVANEAAWLTAFREESTAYTPWAVAPDIVLLYLICVGGDAELERIARRSGLNEDLTDAAARFSKRQPTTERATRDRPAGRAPQPPRQTGPRGDRPATQPAASD